MLPYVYDAQAADANIVTAIDEMAAGRIDAIALTNLGQVRRLVEIARAHGCESGCATDWRVRRSPPSGRWFRTNSNPTGCAPTSRRPTMLLHEAADIGDGGGARKGPRRGGAARPSEKSVECLDAHGSLTILPKSRGFIGFASSECCGLCDTSLVFFSYFTKEKIEKSITTIADPTQCKPDTVLILLPTSHDCFKVRDLITIVAQSLEVDDCHTTIFEPREPLLLQHVQALVGVPPGYAEERPDLFLRDLKVAVRSG